MNVLLATWRQAFLDNSVNDAWVTKIVGTSRNTSVFNGVEPNGRPLSAGQAVVAYNASALDVAGRMTMKRLEGSREMKRNVTGRIAIAAIGGLSALLLSVSPAQAKETAGHWYGPYSTQGICEYWRNGVQAGGTQTHPCFDDQGWYFWAAS
ncbi:hypothetical protein AB0L53_37925 [Nonomuraea sp. NPDC052129]|uniref:hypothetical protein n=1 Tax=Nonomuraea sp. NPDC052129 TaxID=3154651 RepID=UPI003433EA6F